MTHNFIVLLGAGILSVLSVVLGFIALVKQKTYIDQNTQKPTEVEVPFFGKMKTNYPSLLFVFLGFALAFYIVRPEQDLTKVWHIEGRFTSDDPNQEWTPANFDLSPKRMEPTIDKDTGRFKVSLDIPVGQTFEDAYAVISYTDDNESASIYTAQAWEDYQSDGLEFIEISKDDYRRYRPIKTQNYNH